MGPGGSHVPAAEVVPPFPNVSLCLLCPHLPFADNSLALVSPCIFGTGSSSALALGASIGFSPTGLQLSDQQLSAFPTSPPLSITEHLYRKMQLVPVPMKWEDLTFTEHSLSAHSIYSLPMVHFLI